MSLVKRAHQLEPEMIALRNAIHANPELAFNEFETTALIETTLQKLGITTHRNGNTPGLIGILEGAKPGKTIGLRADIDALPVDEETGLPFVR